MQNLLLSLSALVSGKNVVSFLEVNQDTSAKSEWQCTYPVGSKVVLVMGGSFNPIHRDHMNILHAAKKFVEKQGYVVEKGFIGLTPQRWLKKKGLGEKDRFSDEDRAEMVKLACEGTSFEYTPEGLLRKGKQRLIDRLRQSNPDLRLIKVAGADVAAKHWSGPKNQLVNSVVVGREGSDFPSALPASGKCSSTSVREALHSGDLKTVRNMVPPKVAEFLVENQKRLLGGLSLEDSFAPQTRRSIGSSHL